MEIILKSKRLRFEIFTIDKVNHTYKKWMNDSEITKFIIKSNINSIKSLKIFVDSLNNSKNFFFRVIDIKSKKHIGNVRIGPLNFKTQCSGYGILIGNKKFHNKGYGKEITNLSLDFLFKFLRFKRIKFDCYTNNFAAINLYQSLGFKEKFKNNKFTTFHKINE